MILLILVRKYLKSKLVRKVLHSFPTKFDMKVTSIQEACHISRWVIWISSNVVWNSHISDRENINRKEIALQSVHEEENIEKGKSSNDHVNESIGMLTKQLSNVMKKFRNTNNYSSYNKDQNNYRRKDVW